MGWRWERTVFDRLMIGFKRPGDIFGFVMLVGQKVFDKLGRFTGIYPKHIVHDQHLTITLHARTDANHWDGESVTHFFGKLSRDTFEQ